MSTRVTNSARETIDGARDYASEALDAASKQLRKGTKKAAKGLKHGGGVAADKLHDASGQVSPQGHSRGSRMRLFLFAGLIAGFVALMFIRRGMGADDDDDDFDDDLA
jgi:hypothetical protein